MSGCCSGNERNTTCAKTSAGADGIDPTAWFKEMIPHCYEYAVAAQAQGKPIVGIMCEYTPRELIMAAGGVPVCLCGGSAETVTLAEEVLPANLCPLIKSTFGYTINQANPFLEMADLIVAETTCDGKKKMYELLADTKPMFVLELPQKQGDDDAFEHWVKELRKFRTELEQRFQVTITEKNIRQAIGTMNRERQLRRDLATLMLSDTPPLTGRQLLDFKSSISGIAADLEQYERAMQIFQKKDGTTAQPLRVLLTGVPIVHGAERVLEIIEAAGGLVVAMDNCTGLKPIWEDVDESANDPILALAEKYFHIPCSVMTRNDRRLDLIRDLTNRYRPDCVIDLIWQACLTYDVESHRIKCLADEELHLPYLRIETDYSPSDSARIKLRVEALFETIRQQDASPGQKKR
ncbi:double-cubane-cluster-containing anaerobic reductase [Planctomycetota bacterium]